MKNDFQPSLIGLSMVTVLLFGAMTIAQKGGPPPPCALIYRPKNGKCNRDICQAECTRERNGTGTCMGPQLADCACIYQRHKNNKCLP
ncbi:unnamed protein product [Brassica oleracea]